MKYNIWILSLGLIFISCGDDIDPDISDQMEIDEYLTDNNLTAQSTLTGLYYIIETEGNGEHPGIASTITVHYRGYLTNGDTFDSSYSRGEPLTFSLLDAIPGWQEGIPLLSKGGSGKLLLPSKLGYGPNPPVGSGIPVNAVLVFDVELIDF